MRSILFLIIIYFIAVSGHNEKPKLILIQNQTEATCVAENYVNSALDFHFTLNGIKISTKIETESFYVYNNAKQNNIICDFENDDHCLDLRHSQNWNRVHAGQHDIAPVTDERWQNFKYYFTNETEKEKKENEKKNIINIEKFFNGSKLKIDLSIKTERDARIAVCNNDIPYINSKCYWILLDAEHAKTSVNTKIIFRKCLRKIYRKYPMNDNYCTLDRNQIKKDINLLTDEEWKHFSLTIDDGKIMLKEASTNDILVEYNDDKPIKNLSHIVFASYYNNKVLWKLHDYSYLSILKSGWIRLNSLQGKKTKCLSLYVALCNNCEMELAFGIDRKSIKKKTGERSKWQHIKLTSKNGERSVLYVNISNETEGFWAIDDLRYCNENEIRVSTLKISSYYLYENLKSCHLLEDKGTIIFSNHPNNTEEYCKNEFFGSNCNISCESIFGRYCNKKKLCHSKNKCTCFAGYSGDNCEKECRNFQYGYNCNEECIHCKFINSYDICDARTGKCNHGCDHGYIGDYCNDSIYPRLSEAPNSKEISNTYIILSIDNIPIIGNITNDTKYNIKYQIDNVKNWTSTDKQPISNKIINITNLKPNTKYIFKAILYTTNKDSQVAEDVNVTIITTQCKVEADIFITPEARSATVNLIHDNETCNENQYYISLKSEKYYFTNKKCKIQKLTPYTNYNITLRNDEKTYTKTKKFETLEDESDPPMNLKHEKSNDQILSLSWNHPNITNGVIKKFQIFFEYNETALTYKPKNINKTYIIEKEAKDYNFEISTEEISKSTIYIVNVCAVNNYLGDNATIAIITSPEKLKFNDSIKVTEITEATATIIIPPVNLKNISNSFLVILLTKNDNVAEINNITANIHSEADMNRIFSDELKETMVIKILNVDNKETQFTIGKNNIQNNINENLKKYLNTTTENKELSSNTHYVLSLLLCSDYRTSLSCTIEKINISTMKLVNDLIYLLILLIVIIPVSGYVCYRKFNFKKLKKKSSSQTNIKTISTDNIELNDVPKNKNAVTKSTETSKIFHEIQTKPLVIVKPKIQSKQIKMDKTNQPSVNVPGTNLSQPNSDLPQTSTSRANLGAQNVTEERANIQTTTKTYHSKLIKLIDLENYIKKAIDTKEIERQYSLFKRGQTESWDYGSLPQNRSKNRYKNLVAYDHSRVKLEKINNDPHSDYINANYINGYKQKNTYIATQGPQETTTNDFWRMIWQENVKFIIMLTNLTETGKKNCEKYWPDMNETSKYDKITVSFIHSDLYADFEYRLFKISCGTENRTVKQYHYTSWPDLGVPAYPQSLVTFIKQMLKISQSSPTVVHCSGGVGPTGTIILCDICLRMAARESAVDCVRYLQEIRDHRPFLVDNSDEYKLVHLVLLECLNNPTNTIQCSNLKNQIEDLIKGGKLEIQLKYLEHIAWQDNVFDKPLKCRVHPENANKNRFQHIIPEEERVYIPKYPTNDEFSDYINAIPVDGFKFKNQYIVTQIPLPNTIQDFWKMVMNKNIKIIVCLNEIPSNDETCVVFWPEENEEIQLECGINLSDVSLRIDEYFDIVTLQLHEKHTDERNKIYIVRYKNWSYDQNVPEDVTSFVVLCEEVEKLSRGKYPTIVMCYDGATACGLFIGHSFIVEKMKLEQEVDSYLALRVIRKNRKQFVNNLEQLQYLYLCAMHYLNMNNIYANFN